ncbi:MAG: metallophosphoesterase [Clostridia bacterium]|nr:metallophosphoesterase [Clostridia bacterium]
MRIIHCADLHLDSDMTSNFPKEVAMMRRRELLMTFHDMAEYAEENSVDAVIIAGDLFDKKTVRRSALRFVLDTVRDHANIDFYYLAGNHEATALTDGAEELPENLKLFGDGWTTYTICDAGGRRITLSGADFAPSESHVMSAELSLSPEDFNIVALHGQITGYTSKEKGDTIDLSQYKNKFIDYLALGHIHSYGEGKLPPRGVWCYPGCLEGRGFDECGEHGFVLLDIGEDGFERKFVPFAKRRIHLVEVPAGECLSSSDAVGAVKAALAEREVGKEDIVRAVLTGEADVDADIDTELINKHFEADHYLFDTVDSTTIKIDYSKFRLDASLKGEFVRLVEAADGIDDAEKAKVIKCGIRALSGEDFGI